jgi:hypothetical protein
MTDIKPRLVRADDFIAEKLEKEASKLPPSEKDKAAGIRAMAEHFRKSSSTAMLRIWEETPGV